VRLLNLVGPERYYETLTRLRLINRNERGPEYYGLGLVVGNPEVSLLQMAGAYACLANGGVYRPLRLRPDQAQGGEVAVFSEQAAFIVSDILADPLARSRAFGNAPAMNPPFHLSIKTGTSTRYRDCWAAAYSPRYTLAVWVGNFDGRPTAQQSGAAAAAPILADMAAALYAAAPAEHFPCPEGVTRAQVCAFSGMRPGPGCAFPVEEFFISGTEPARECTYHRPHSPWHRLDTAFAGWLQQRHEKAAEGRYRLAGFDADLQRVFRPETAAPPPASAWASPTAPDPGKMSRINIVYPLPGDRFLLAPRDEGVAVTLKAMCRSRMRQVSWFVDGREVGTVGPPYHLTVSLARGRHHLTALGPDGLGDTVEVSVQ